MPILPICDVTLHRWVAGSRRFEGPLFAYLQECRTSTSLKINAGNRYPETLRSLPG